MNREKETELSSTPLNPIFGIEMNRNELQNDSIVESAETDENV